MGPFKGSGREWYESDRRYADESYRFVVALGDSQVEALAGFLQSVCSRFRQEAHYLELIAADVRLIRPLEEDDVA